MVLKTDREIKRTRHLSVRLIEFPCRDYLPIIISCREEIRYFRLRGTLSTKLLSIKHSRILFLKISWRVNCVWCKDCVVCFFKVMLVCVWLGWTKLCLIKAAYGRLDLGSGHKIRLH